MEITEVKVFPVNEEKLKAFVSVVFDRCFMVNDIKVIHGKQGLFISMPSRKKKNGEFKDVAHPLNNETRRMLEDHVLAEYDRVLEERGMKPERRGARSQKAAAKAAPKAAAPPSAGTKAPAKAEESEVSPAKAEESEVSPAKAEESEVSPAKAETPGPQGEGKKEKEKSSEKTLEEVEEMHLRDSFWSVT